MTTNEKDSGLARIITKERWTRKQLKEMDKGMKWKRQTLLLIMQPWRATKKRRHKLTFLNFMGRFAVPKVSSPEKLQDNIKINK